MNTTSTPRFRKPFANEFEPADYFQRLNQDELFSRPAPLEVDLGAGDGSYILALAEHYPERNFLAVERLLGRVQKICRRSAALGLKNLKVLRLESSYTIEWLLPHHSVNHLHIICPDPWPKARHHRRRFVTQEHLVPLHTALEPGAEFRIATDIPDYVRQAMEEVPKAGFEWRATKASDWRDPWSDWYSTRYEQKALREGRVPHYLTFRRL